MFQDLGGRIRGGFFQGLVKNLKSLGITSRLKLSQMAPEQTTTGIVG